MSFEFITAENVHTALDAFDQLVELWENGTPMNTNGIKPIETHYKGYRFRSRLEARWAVFFDALGIKWEYEKEGFELGNGVLYLPDFYLPTFDIWAEIKSNSLTKNDYLKCEMFREKDEAILLCVGLPDENYMRLFCHDLSDSSGGSNDFDCEFLIDGMDEVHIATLNKSGRSYYSDTNFERILKISNYWPDQYKRIDMYQKAVCAARSARFEHGENGSS